MPTGCATFEEAVDSCYKVHSRLLQGLDAAGYKYFNTGALGGVAPQLENAEEALRAVRDAIAATESMLPLRLGIHVGAERMINVSERVEGEEDVIEETLYDVAKWNKALTATPKNGEELIDLFVDWLMKYQISYLLDPFAHADTQSFMHFKDRFDTETQRAKEQEEANEDGGVDEPVIHIEEIGGDPTCLLQVVGDQACKSESDLDTHHEAQTANTLLLTMSKGKTVTGCVAMALKAQSLGWGVIVSVETECEESLDDFVAHLAVGVRAGQFRGGGLAGSEYTSKYNALFRVASDGDVPYAGASFRNFHT